MLFAPTAPAWILVPKPIQLSPNFMFLTHESPPEVSLPVLLLALLGHRLTHRILSAGLSQEQEPITGQPLHSDFPLLARPRALRLGEFMSADHQSPGI